MMSALTVKGLSQIDSARTMQYVIEDHSFLWKNNVPLSGYSYRDPMINASVIKTVRLHKKSDSKLAMGMIFSSVGVLITGFALLDDLSSPEPGGNVTISESYGPAPLAVTGVLLGVSLPFFISSISNKRKMEESLVETKRLLVQ
jgi:hypothetical protein